MHRPCRYGGGVGGYDLTMESCEGCGFIWVSVSDDEFRDRILSGISEMSALISRSPQADAHPDPQTWSVIEYGSHVRDVLLHVRDRIVIALVEDCPEFKPLYRDQRADLGFYLGDTPDVVCGELAMASSLFTRTLERIPAGGLDRPCMYAFPTLGERSVRWMVQQVIHEVEHHLGDIRVQIKGSQNQERQNQERL